MAKYCDSCSNKYGLLTENNPTLCEGCGKKIVKVETDFYKVIKAIAFMLLASFFLLLLKLGLS